MRVNVLLLILFLSLPAFSVTFSLEHKWNTASPNFLGVGILQKQPLFFEKVSAQLGLKTTFSSKDLISGNATIQFFYAPLDWVSINARLNQILLFSNTITQTQTGVLATLSPSLGPITFFTTLGWYRRWTTLRKVTVLPSLLSSSFSEHDAILGLGIGWKITPSKELQLRVGNYEDFEIFNINNPFIEFKMMDSAIYEDTVFSFFLRYQILLGFGRMDRFIVGLFLSY